MDRAKNEKLSSPMKVFAYGFDAAGFSTRDKPVALDDEGAIQFVPFDHSTSLDSADGVIIPQGIFEEFEQVDSHSPLFPGKTTISVHWYNLVERERQLFDMLRKGKWVCFLVGEIKDMISQGFHLESIKDTDLCKRILNAFMIERHRRYNVDVPLPLKSRDKEFDVYADRYGTPTTVLELPHKQTVEHRVIMELGDNAVGVEFDSRLFFLPFQSFKKDVSTAVSVAKTLTLAISEYRRNRITKIPTWVDELRFKREKTLYLEINSLLGKVNRLESELDSWRDYRATLIVSGALLTNKVVAILESVFELKVEFEDDGEEAIAIDHEGCPLLMIETNSTEGAVEKECIDRACLHRQSRGLSESLPTILFVNCDMTVTDIQKRVEKNVPQEIIEYARDRKILIIRTIDLLFLARDLEDEPRKKDRLMHLLRSGGGWLKASIGGCEIV